MTKLSNVEKYAIESMVGHGKSIEDIEKELGRQDDNRVVKNYIKKITANQIDEEEKEEKKVYKVPKEIKEETLDKLNAVVGPTKAIYLFNLAETKLGRLPKNATEMYNFCLNQQNVLSLMITETPGGRSKPPRVAVMTAAASSLADDRKGNRTSKQNTSDSIYHPKNT